MGKPWSDFSGLGRVSVAKSFFISVLMVMAPASLILSPLVHAEDSVLPEYTLEREQGAERVKVGDQIRLRIEGLLSSGEISLDAEAGKEKVRSESGWELLSKPDGELKFSATVLKPGRIELPSHLIKDASGKPIGRTRPFVVEVETAIKPDDPSPQQPADLRPPVGLEFPWWALVVLGLLGIALLSGIIYLIIRTRRKRPVELQLPPLPPKPEDEVALAALLELERQALVMKGNFKKHYFRVSEILKTYLGARFEFDALESTTREMISVLDKKQSMSESRIDQIEKYFEKLDIVKFTDHVPAHEDASRIVSDAREIILSTKKATPFTDLTGPTEPRMERNAP